jgi:hypothetical protein
MDLVQQRKLGRGYGPCPEGSVGCHLAEAQRPPLERDDSPGVVLADDSHQADPGLSEAGQHRLVVPEHPLLLRLRGVLTVDFGTPSYEFTVNICTYLIS